MHGAPPGEASLVGWTAVTDAQGRFRLEGLPGEMIDVQVTRPLPTEWTQFPGVTVGDEGLVRGNLPAEEVERQGVVEVQFFLNCRKIYHPKVANLVDGDRSQPTSKRITGSVMTEARVGEQTVQAAYAFVNFTPFPARVSMLGVS